jgi:hypothetical protein
MSQELFDVETNQPEAEPTREALIAGVEGIRVAVSAAFSVRIWEQKSAGVRVRYAIERALASCYVGGRMTGEYWRDENFLDVRCAHLLHELLAEWGAWNEQVWPVLEPRDEMRQRFLKSSPFCPWRSQTCAVVSALASSAHQFFTNQIQKIVAAAQETPLPTRAKD